MWFFGIILSQCTILPLELERCWYTQTLQYIWSSSSKLSKKYCVKEENRRKHVSLLLVAIGVYVTTHGSVAYYMHNFSFGANEEWKKSTRRRNGAQLNPFATMKNLFLFISCLLNREQNIQHTWKLKLDFYLREFQVVFFFLSHQLFLSNYRCSCCTSQISTHKMHMRKIIACRQIHKTLLFFICKLLFHNSYPQFKIHTVYIL